MTTRREREGRVARESRPVFVLSRAIALVSVAVATGAAGVLAQAACGSGGDVAVGLDAGSALCPAEAGASDPSWVPPSDAGGPCGATALALLASAFGASTPAPYTQIEAALRASEDGGGAACASCVFTQPTSPVWGPIVYDDGGAFVNYGACWTLAPGGSAACGAAVEKQILCIDQVCSLAACGPDALTTCAQRALQEDQGCGRFQVPAACGDAVASLASICGSALDVVTRVCGLPAGSDAGSR